MAGIITRRVSLVTRDTSGRFGVLIWKKLLLQNSHAYSHIQGIAFVDQESLGKTIRYFPKSALEREPKQRFQQLFQSRKKWSRSEILPYVLDLAESEKKLDVVFLKFARMSKEGSTVYYSSRVALWNILRVVCITILRGFTIEIKLYSRYNIA